MKNAVKNTLLAGLLGLLTAGAAGAQPAPASGRIHYEATQRNDPSQLHLVINGQEVKPGSPDFPTDLPETRSFGLTLTFAGKYAKEERENNIVMRTVEGPGAAPQTTSLPRPVQEATYLDLAGRTTTTVLTVKQNGALTTYRSDAPIAAPTGWAMTTQTRKIAGYTCRKATVPYRQETYTVWVTTELPFTYSPVRELTPEKGVVLALESEQEQYRAAKVDQPAVPEADVRPSPSARPVTAAELTDRRAKALADFRQRLLEGSRN